VATPCGFKSHPPHTFNKQKDAGNPAPFFLSQIDPGLFLLAEDLVHTGPAYAAFPLQRFAAVFHRNFNSIHHITFLFFLHAIALFCHLILLSLVERDLNTTSSIIAILNLDTRRKISICLDFRPLWIDNENDN
jgi:hypothetical protein